MRFPEGLRALNHRDFQLFFAGQLISQIGTWMQSVGQAWLILQLTSSPFLLGLISTLQWTPALLFSLHAGAIVDRLPKRKLVIFTQTGMMFCAFILSALAYSHTVRYWHVAVLALLLGLFNTLDIPARQSFMVEMVGKPDLMNAIALNSAIFNGARILGPAVAGILIGKYGVAPAFLANGVSFIAVIAALFAISAQGLPPDRKRGSMAQEIQEGLVYVYRTPLSLMAISLLATVGLFVINFQVTVPLLAKMVLHLGAQGFGFLMSAMGLGALIGAIMLAMVGKQRPSINLIIGTGVVLSFVVLITCLFPFPSAAAVFLAITGFCQISFSASINTLLQITTPDALRGRVMSLFALVFAGSTPIGSFFLGVITDWFGAAAGWYSSGALGLISVIVLTVWWRLKGTRMQQQHPV